MIYFAFCHLEVVGGFRILCMIYVASNLSIISISFHYNKKIVKGKNKKTNIQFRPILTIFHHVVFFVADIFCPHYLPFLQYNDCDLRAHEYSKEDNCNHSYVEIYLPCQSKLQKCLLKMISFYRNVNLSYDTNILS